jgi:hypothetical protein
LVVAVTLLARSKARRGGLPAEGLIAVDAASAEDPARGDGPEQAAPVPGKA